MSNPYYEYYYEPMPISSEPDQVNPVAEEASDEVGIEVEQVSRNGARAVENTLVWTQGTCGTIGMTLMGSTSGEQSQNAMPTYASGNSQ
ncbi:hypothetical protein Bca4012_020173 [Brassica carinata]|uniref:Uncharacterized protein n=1 Tax=Brassica carinata TaxID=52824 RepID=A0A8X8B9R3_BRACI|nr:hypothetical protein Bca52824_001414 [Brassica carinata]